MRPTFITLAAAGFSAWLPLDYLNNSFDTALGLSLSAGASLVASVQHTLDELNNYVLRSVTRVTTTATVAETAHGLSVGDWVSVRNSGSSNLDGNFAVASVPNANTYTYTVSNTGISAALPEVATARVFTHPSLLGRIARADGVYSYPVRAIRINHDSYTSGQSRLAVLQNKR